MADMDTFPGRNRYIDPLCHFGQGAEIFRRYRFLDPARLERFQIAADGDGDCRREAAMHLNENLYIGPHGRAYGFHQREGEASFRPGDIKRARSERVEFQRPVATLHYPLRGLMERFGSPFNRVPTVSICFDAIAYRASEEPIDRLIKRLAHDVPAGHLYDADTRHLHLTRAAVIVVPHALHQRFDGARVGSENVIATGYLQVPE